MTTSNHILTGSIIALTIKEPMLALPLAFASHFVLDALPHYGNNDPKLKPKVRLGKYLRVEMVGIAGIVILLSTGIYGWNVVTAAALLAILPDAEWPLRYYLYTRKGRKGPKSITATIHKKIQWMERGWGVVVEVLYFAAGYLLLLDIIKDMN